jgi:peptide/nickel transport system ATP-binding protein
MMMQSGEAFENLDVSDLAGHRVTQSFTRDLLKASKGFDRSAQSRAQTT